MNDALKQEVLDIMATHVLCVLSTVDGQGRPESAIVGFSNSQNLELLIGTSNTSRKFVNLQTNPHVAVVIGDEKSEIQYEGIATISDAEDERLRAHFAKVPGSAKYREDPSQVYLLIAPEWLRLTVHENPNRVEEMSFA